MVYMPFVVNRSNKTIPFAFTLRARELFNLIKNDRENQKRPKLIWDDVLAEIAYEHCKDMTLRNFWGHINPDGIGPNQRILNKNYFLPPEKYAGLRANNTESLAAGDSTTQGTRNAWLNSSGHRSHVFGIDLFYREQTRAAVGYCEGGFYKRYWCFLSCHSNT